MRKLTFNGKDCHSSFPVMHKVGNVDIFTVRKRSCGKVMFSQARVKNSVHRGSRDGHCSGRYASYWNAFLLQLFKFKTKQDIYLLMTSIAIQILMTNFNCTKIDLIIGNYFQFLAILTCTKLPMLPTLCVLGKTRLQTNSMTVKTFFTNR